MSRYIITPDAEMDLELIQDHIALDSERQAEKFLERLPAEFGRLAAMPRMGRGHPDFGADVRSIPLRPYIIYYQPLADGVEILRVIHGARDLRKAFGDPPTP